MKNFLQLSVVLVAVLLVPLTWYTTLMPHWLAQSGERNETVYYSQGIGLWLNYTEHVGDARFDPGNSLWIPPQETGADTYSTQCSVQHPFCAEAVGELHRQYCQVMEVYCGPAMTFLQWMLSGIAGVSVVIATWSIHLITTTHCTVADLYLMYLCFVNGISNLIAAVVWYFFVFRRIIISAFYLDQFSRCSENDSGRSCWQIGRCVYFLIVGGILNSLLAILVMSHVTNKFRRFRQLLRRMYETIAVVEAPRPLVHMKTEVLASRRNGTSESMEVAVDVEGYLKSTKLAPLKKHPSAVGSRGVSKNDSRDRKKTNKELNAVQYAEA